VQPKRFDLTFINENGKEEQPIVIHRSSIGAIERTMAFLIEHYGGNFPVWLSPTQVEIIPISDRHLNYASEVKQNLVKKGLRTQVNAKTEPLGAKIRSAQLEKIPYMLIVGDKEQVKQQV
jgi:threonyl-tRNA synthetase